MKTIVLPNELTAKLHDVTVNSENRCQCCGDMCLQVQIDGENIHGYQPLANGYTGFIIHDQRFIFRRTLDQLRVEAGLLTADEFAEAAYEGA